MPLFRVYKGQDAYVNYVSVIEADTPAEATQLASMHEFRNGDHWVPTGDTNEYDHAQIFEDMVEPVEGNDLAAAMAELKAEHDFSTIDLAPEQRDVIIAALRFWQRWAGDLADEEILELARNGRETFLSDEDIDDLIEGTINV